MKLVIWLLIVFNIVFAAGNVYFLLQGSGGPISAAAAVVNSLVAIVLSNTLGGSK